MTESNKDTDSVVADFFTELAKSARESAAKASSLRRVGFLPELGLGYGAGTDHLSGATPNDGNS